MFGDELLIGSVRVQVNRLKDILAQMEMDERLKEHAVYYASQVHNIERNLRRIRKADLEFING